MKPFKLTEHGDTLCCCTLHFQIWPLIKDVAESAPLQADPDDHEAVAQELLNRAKVAGVEEVARNAMGHFRGRLLAVKAAQYAVVPITERTVVAKNGSSWGGLW